MPWWIITWRGVGCGFGNCYEGATTENQGAVCLVYGLRGVCLTTV